MDKGKVTVTFRGICTHFHHNFVPGFPHRVVLPDASSVNFGEVRTLETLTSTFGPPAYYYTIPHFAFIHPNPMGCEGDDAGFLLAGARVSIANAVEGAVEYDASFRKLIHSLSEFVSDYEPSNNVVSERKAACHFNVTSGKVWAVEEKGVSRVMIEIKTDGPPILSVDSLRPGLWEVLRFTLDNDAKLTVANLELERRDDAPSFDYLLHYLTNRHGIPVTITQLTPGMKTGCSKTKKEFAAALCGLGEYIGEYPKKNEQLEKAVGMDVTASCADSRFP
ncbi:MAG: hypothetical protein QOE68_3948 [Thermoanaerobaculia bacterium]|jgi:hypothetical protein|nr:hypothetical protein [Thermoanaerobaculia bacterium]